MLWWGSAQTVPSISALLPMPSDATQASDLFVLSDTALQRWQLSLDEPEKVCCLPFRSPFLSVFLLFFYLTFHMQLLYEMPLQSLLRPIFQDTEPEGYSVGEIWLLDIYRGRYP
jgi:hypothetical protein